eukprot:GHVQ01006986.1.p1 GENE.GHVQ01006986.1~~GHVQ01006986.1.p1  ORF type:complete len:116 (+),score=10.43 GHVQ01006986.1:136-483(+)
MRCQIVVSHPTLARHSFTRTVVYALSVVLRACAILLSNYAQVTEALTIDPNNPFPAQDNWIRAAEFIRRQWFQYLLIFGQFALFLFVSQMSCLQPADPNEFSKTKTASAKEKKTS